MIRSMLVLNPNMRATAAELLQHKWLSSDHSTHVARKRNDAVSALMMRRLRSFGSLQRLQKVALMAMVRTLHQEDVQQFLVCNLVLAALPQAVQMAN
jgi:serine/threonine protein kinase